MEKPQYIGTTEASRRCGRHPRTIITWIQDGKLSALRLPGERSPYLIDPDELEALLLDMMTPQPVKPEKRKR